MITNFVQANGEKQMNRHDNKGLIESLINSKIFQDYEKAFSETTGLPVSLRAGGIVAVAPPRQAPRESLVRHAGGKEPVLRDLSANAAAAFGKRPV